MKFFVIMAAMLLSMSSYANTNSGGSENCTGNCQNTTFEKVSLSPTGGESVTKIDGTWFRYDRASSQWISITI